MDESIPAVTVAVAAAPEPIEEEETEEIQTTADAILEDTKWLKERLEKLELVLANLEKSTNQNQSQAGLSDLMEAKAEIKGEIANLRIELGNLKQSLASPLLPTSSLEPEPEPIPETVNPAEEAENQEGRIDLVPQRPKRRRI